MVTIPQPPAADFTTTIDNPYLPMRPGTTFVYENKDTNEVVMFEVTRQTKVVDGVTCVAVHDVSTQNGLLLEDTFDWFAQDKNGNVWYFGELSKSYDPGDPVVKDTHGSWEAGVNGAKAGIVMLAAPKVADQYAQEFAPGIAEDQAKVLSLTAGSDTPYGSFSKSLKTADINPLESATEFKYFVKDVGNVLTVNADGEREQLVEIIVRGTAQNDNLVGYAGGDTMYGGRGADTIHGGGGNDKIHGGLGDDKLYGGSGHDMLYGERGNDIMQGGAGSDTFVFNQLSNGVKETDAILDYNKSALDVIDLGGKSNVAKETLVGSVWELTLKGDNDIVKIHGAVDANHDGHIVDDLLIL